MGMADSFFSAIPGLRRWWRRRKWTSLDVPAEKWAAIDGMIEDLQESLTNVRSLETLLENAAVLRAGHGMNARTVYHDHAGKEHAVEIILDGTTATEKLIEGYQYVRCDLSAMEEADLVKRRKTLYESLYPETRAGAAQAAGMNRAKGNNVSCTVQPMRKSFLDKRYNSQNGNKIRNPRFQRLYAPQFCND